MINIDIVGDFRATSNEILENREIELYLINKISHPSDFQEVLIVYPPPKKKFRWKAYSPEEAEILQKYVEDGGILVLIPPFNPLYREKLSEIFEKFEISPVFRQENVLAHVNGHMINNGVERKLPLKKFVHFLILHRESLEIIIEGNYQPIYAFLFLGKGAIVLYGLGSKHFWQEDLVSIFKYLQRNYTHFWEKSELTEAQLENVLKITRKKEHQKIRKAFIQTFVQKKHFNDFLEIKDPRLKQSLLKRIPERTISEEFKDLSGKFIVKKYRELYRLLHKDYPALIKKIQKFLYSKIMDRTINEKSFHKLYETDLLPPEAAYLLIFYLDPEDPENYKKFKDNLSKLIQWNKKEKIFDENYLKELAWKHL
ncbi:MAG: hypothetical protein ACTSRS_18720 [Candidatus Helarchaeota archaeon]